jgi:ATP-dependent RNA helicase DeaD
LIEKYEPTAVVATLLKLATPRLPRDPLPVKSLEPRADGPAKVSQGYIRYAINWGMQRGANPDRLIAHICRRGEISSKKIGAVDLGADSSFFEVAQEASQRFEERVAKPDSRDPHIKIRRAGSGESRGPRPDRARRPRFRGPKRRRPH